MGHLVMYQILSQYFANIDLKTNTFFEKALEEHKKDNHGESTYQACYNSLGTFCEHYSA